MASFGIFVFEPFSNSAWERMGHPQGGNGAADPAGAQARAVKDGTPMR